MLRPPGTAALRPAIQGRGERHVVSGDDCLQERPSDGLHATSGAARPLSAAALGVLPCLVDCATMW